jgi:hypothetical protein
MLLTNYFEIWDLWQAFDDRHAYALCCVLTRWLEWFLALMPMRENYSSGILRMYLWISYWYHVH